MVPSNSVYPWRNLSLLLITSNSATGTPPKGSYTVTLKSLGLVEENTTTLPSTLLSLPKPREQYPSSVRGINKTTSVILYKHYLSKRYLEVIKNNE